MPDSAGAGVPPAAEIARLRQELAEARRRIAELEQLRAQALDRIEWALDSLHSLAEKAD